MLLGIVRRLRGHYVGKGPQVSAWHYCSYETFFWGIPRGLVDATFVEIADGVTKTTSAQRLLCVLIIDVGPPRAAEVARAHFLKPLSFFGSFGCLIWS